MKYSNPEYDRLDDVQRREWDPEERNALLLEASQVVWEDLPVGVLYFVDGTAGWSTRVHNFVPTEFGGFFWSLPFVWVES